MILVNGRLVKELSVLCEYPGSGGSSGTFNKNRSRLTLKSSNEDILVKFGGRTFQSFAAFIVKLWSYIVSSLPLSLGNGFTMAFMAEVLR